MTGFIIGFAVGVIVSGRVCYRFGRWHARFGRARQVMRSQW